MEELGKVVKVSGKTATVEVKKKDECGSCKVCAFGRSGVASFVAHNEPNARQGDQVIVRLPEPKQLTATLAVYVVPLIAMALGFLVGFNVFENEAARYATVFAFIFLGFFGVALINKVVAKQPGSLASIVKVLPTGKAGEYEEAMKKEPSLGGEARGVQIEDSTKLAVSRAAALKENDVTSEVSRVQTMDVINEISNQNVDDDSLRGIKNESYEGADEGKEPR